MSYCDFVANLPADNVHKIYHDQHYGFRIESDDELFGRLIMEINQAGLSWETILKKEQGFRNAYEDFSIEKIASYGESDFERLKNDAGIIRNKLKINAAIHNANRIIEIQNEFGSFRQWIDLHAGLTLQEWVKLFKKNFKFVGGEIVNEFLMSIGILPGAHTPNCPIFHKLENLNKR